MKVFAKLLKLVNVQLVKTFVILVNIPFLIENTTTIPENSIVRSVEIFSKRNKKRFLMGWITVNLILQVKRRTHERSRTMNFIELSGIILLVGEFFKWSY